VWVNATGFYDNFSDVARDPTFPSGDRPDEEYLGFEGTFGLNIPVYDYVSIGGTVTGFSAGDLYGYNAQAFVSIDLWSLLKQWEK
jgi:hypothetical protein